MKIKIYFLMVLLSSSYTAQAGIFVESDNISIKSAKKVYQKCNSLEDLKSFEERKRELLEENFKDAKCITRLEEFTTVDEKFKLLKRNFPNDLDLTLFHARVLLQFRKIDEGLDQFAKFLVSKNANIENKHEEFIRWLEDLNIDGQSLRDYTEIIGCAVKNPQNLKSLIVQQNIRKTTNNFLVDNISVLFNLLAKHSNKNLYDATLLTVIPLLRSSHFSNTLNPLLNKLYVAKKDNPSFLLKKYYGYYCLMPAKAYTEYIKLFEPIVLSNLEVPMSYHDSVMYQSLSTCYLLTIQFEKTSDDGAKYKYSPEDEEKIQKAITLINAVLSPDAAQMSDGFVIGLLDTLGCAQILLNQYGANCKIRRMSGIIFS